MSLISEVLKNNEGYASNFGDKGSLPLPPGRKLAVLACMDARLDPYKALGLKEGDAHVIRNAGGLAPDAIRSLIISQQLLGTNTILILQHTDCGMLTFKQEDAVGLVKKNLGLDASSIDFQAFANLEESVKSKRFIHNATPYLCAYTENVATLKANPLIKTDQVFGGIYEVETGKIRIVA